MGHEIVYNLYKKSQYKTSEKAIECYLESMSDDRNFNLSSVSQFKSCSLSGNTQDELTDSFEKVLSNRYFNQIGSYSSISLPNDEIYKSKKVLDINEKVRNNCKDIETIENDHCSKLKDQKVVKCKICKHVQSKVRSLLSCEKCQITLLKETTIKKIDKITEKNKVLKEKREELISKAKKEESWIMGVEYHT